MAGDRIDDELDLVVEALGDSTVRMIEVHALASGYLDDPANAERPAECRANRAEFVLRQIRLLLAIAILMAIAWTATGVVRNQQSDSFERGRRVRLPVSVRVE